MSLGGLEIAALAVLALLIFGPERLPEIARSMGKTINAVRREARATLQSLSDEADLSEIRSMANDLRGEAAGLRGEAADLRKAASLSGPVASPARPRATPRPEGPTPFDPDAT